MRGPALLTLLLLDLGIAVLAVSGVGWGVRSYLHPQLRYGFVETTLVCDVIVAVTVLASYATGLHTRAVLCSARQRWVRAGFVGAAAITAALIVSYLVWYQTIGRIVVVATGLAIALGVWLLRCFAARILARSPRERVVIYGQADAARGFAAALSELVNTRCWVSDVVEAGADVSTDQASQALIERCQAGSTDRVVVLPGPTMTLPNAEAVDALAELGVRTQSAATLWMEETGRVPPEFVDAAWLLRVLDRRAQPGRLQIRRLLDLGWALLGLPVLVLAVPVVWLLHRLDGGGPLFFVQPRVGLGGRRFHMLKFRSMRPSLDRVARFAATDDGRTTRVGRFLRRHRIDELPQLINVIRGEMSIVGPRPEQAQLARALATEIPGYDHRLLVPPGITGWAQIHHGYADSVASSRLKLGYDLYYVAHHGPLLDLDIIARTFYVLLARIGAR